MNKEELFKKIEELEKALEAKKAELEKQDRLKNYEDVKAGETFTYKGHEYTKLRNGKAIINDYSGNFIGLRLISGIKTDGLKLKTCKYVLI